MDAPSPANLTPPPLPGRLSTSPVAVPALILGILAVVFSPLLIGIVPGVAGLILAILHLRRNRQQRRLAWWGGGLAVTGTILGIVWGGVLIAAVLRFVRPFNETGSPTARADLAAADARASYREAGVLADKGATKARVLSCFCLDREDNILACDEEGKCVRVITPDNALRATWPVDFWPQAIACRDDGSVIVAGTGRVALLDAGGQVQAVGSLPQPPGRAAAAGDVAAAARRRYESAVTAVAALGDDILACGRANTGYTIYRLNGRLEGATPIVKGLTGCCGQMDMTTRDGIIYVAANCDSKVLKYDRDGKKLGGLGRTGKGIETCFDGCCEPKNVAFGPDGSLYVAGSGTCSVSRYSADGQFLDYVGRVNGITGCVRVTVAVNRDASRVYMLDTDRHAIRVLARREPVPAATPTGAAPP